MLYIVLLICCRIFGDYESLKGGQAKDAMVDMTGGVGEALELRDYTKTEEDKLKLFKILRKCKEHHSLISAAIPVILEKLLSSENDGNFSLLLLWVDIKFFFWHLMFNLSKVKTIIIPIHD